MDRKKAKEASKTAVVHYGWQKWLKSLIPNFPLQKLGLEDEIQVAQGKEILLLHQPLANAGAQAVTRICTGASAH